MSFEIKYIKYKNKYLNLKNKQIGGKFSPMLIQRLKREMKTLTDSGIIVNDFNEDTNILQISINGPPGTLYEGVIFNFDIIFSSIWPFEAPKFKLMTNIFHPNIMYGIPIWLKNLAKSSSFSEYGTDTWNTSRNLNQIMTIIINLLIEPDINNTISSIANEEASILYRRSKEASILYERNIAALQKYQQDLQKYQHDKELYNNKVLENVQMLRLRENVQRLRLREM